MGNYSVLVKSLGMEDWDMAVDYLAVELSLLYMLIVVRHWLLRKPHWLALPID